MDAAVITEVTEMVSVRGGQLFVYGSWATKKWHFTRLPAMEQAKALTELDLDIDQLYERFDLE